MFNFWKIKSKISSITGKIETIAEKLEWKITFENAMLWWNESLKKLLIDSEDMIKNNLITKYENVLDQSVRYVVSNIVWNKLNTVRENSKEILNNIFLKSIKTTNCDELWKPIIIDLKELTLWSNSWYIPNGDFEYKAYVKTLTDILNTYNNNLQQPGWYKNSKLPLKILLDLYWENIKDLLHKKIPYPSILNEPFLKKFDYEFKITLSLMSKKANTLEIYALKKLLELDDSKSKSE
jgi:hypothetical protein